MYERPQNYVDIFVYFVWHLRCAPIRRSGQGSHLVPANLHLQDWHFFPHTATPIINWQSLKSSSRKQKNTVHWPLSNFITRQIPEIWLNWDAVRLAVASCLAKVSSFFISYINWMANTRHQKKNPQQNPLIFCRQFGGQLPRQSDFFESLVFLFTLRFGVDIMGFCGGVRGKSLYCGWYMRWLELMTSLAEPKNALLKYWGYSIVNIFQFVSYL